MTLPWPRDWGQLQGGRGQEFLWGGGGGRDSVLGTMKMHPPPPAPPGPAGHTLSTPTSQESCRKAGLGRNSCAIRSWRNPEIS